MVHCNQRGSEIISGDYGHTFKFEQGEAQVQRFLVDKTDYIGAFF